MQGKMKNNLKTRPFTYTIFCIKIIASTMTIRNVKICYYFIEKMCYLMYDEPTENPLCR